MIRHLLISTLVIVFAVPAVHAQIADEEYTLIQSVQRPPADILRFNAWLKSYAMQKGAVFADYYSATVDASGFLRDGTTNDGLHPNPQGYALMAPVVTAAIAQALK
jgi:lysophospholipase L1-like esterase